METSSNIFLKTQNSELEVKNSILHRKFRTLAKEYFDVEITADPDPMQKIREASKFNSFSLPANFSEVFIRAEESDIFWILKTPLNNYIEDYFKLYFSKSSSFELFKSAKEYYQKWVLQKSIFDKKYYASSFVNLSEKISPSNFYYQLLTSVIFSNETSLLSFQKSEDALAKAKEAIIQSKISSTYRDELLYIIELLSGFNDLKQSNFPAAQNKFSSAIRINPFGITSKFYLAFTELKQNNIDVVRHLLKEILSFDKFRCGYAINENNGGMLSHFIHHPVIINTFYYDEFSAISEFFIDELTEIKSNSFEGINNLHYKLERLSEIKLEKYYDDEYLKIMAFLSQAVINRSGGKTNILLFYINPELQDRYNYAINHLKQSIREKFIGEMQTKLDLYKSDIDLKFKRIEQLKTEQTEYIQKLKTNLHSSIQNVDLNIAEQITATEKKIKDINGITRLNPMHSFSKSMVYNFVFSSLIFLMGGCAGYTDTFMYGVRDLKNIIGVVFVSGIKWGGLSFSFGILIASMVAVYIKIERSNQKQKLVRFIGSLKDKKEKDKEALNKDFTAHEKLVTSNYLKKINTENDQVETILKTKEQEEIILTQDAEEKIQQEFKKLEAFL